MNFWHLGEAAVLRHGDGPGGQCYSGTLFSDWTERHVRQSGIRLMLVQLEQTIAKLFHHGITLSAVQVDPVKIAFLFTGMSLTSLFWGGKIFWMGLAGWRRASYPLTQSKDLTGWSARLVSGAIMLFGIITFTCGIVTAYFGIQRCRQLF